MLPFYGKYLNHERNFSMHIHDILACSVTSAGSWNVSARHICHIWQLRCDSMCIAHVTSALRPVRSLSTINNTVMLWFETKRIRKLYAKGRIFLNFDVSWKKIVVSWCVTIKGLRIILVNVWRTECTSVSNDLNFAHAKPAGKYEGPWSESGISLIQSSGFAVDCEQSLFFFSLVRGVHVRASGEAARRGRVAICVSCVLLDGLQKKERLLVV